MNVLKSLLYMRLGKRVPMCLNILFMGTHVLNQCEHEVELCLGDPVGCQCL